MSIQSFDRQQCRTARNKLSNTQQQCHAVQARRLLLLSGLLRGQQKIAFFLDGDGELPTQKLIQYLWSQGKHVYLPVIQADASLLFSRYLPNSHFKKNKYGIAEVVSHQTLKAADLDLVFTPLSCFDEAGYRIGMGGGFYDRSFQFKNQRPYANKHQQPKLIGWAHEGQKITKVNVQYWDVRLDYCVTERAYRRFNR